MSWQRPIRVSFSMAAAAAAAVCASQKPTGAGNLTINGSLAVSANTPITVHPYSVAQAFAPLDVPRHVAIASDGNDSGRTFIITGYDRKGSPLTESLAGPDTASVSTLGNFSSVTSVHVDAATAGNITVGTGNSAETAWLPVNRYAKYRVLGLQTVFSSGASLSVQWQSTMDDVQDGNAESGYYATNVGSALVASASSSSTGVPVVAMRAKVTSYVSGTASLTVMPQ